MNCSSGCFPAQVQVELQLKDCFCTNESPICLTGEKVNLFHSLESSFSKLEYSFYKSHTRTISGVWVVGFFSLFQPATVPFLSNRLFLQPCKRCLNQPAFTMPWTLDAPVLNAPGFNLKLGPKLGRPMALLSNRSDSPHFGRQSLLEPSLQILHVG